MAPSQVRRRTAASATAARRRRSSGRRGELEHALRESVGSGLREQAADAILDERQRPAGGNGDDGQAARLGLEDDLPEGVGGAGEQEDVGAGVGARELDPAEPAEEGGVLVADAHAQALLLGAAAGEDEVQARVAAARVEERVGEQVGALLDGEASGVEDVELAGQRELHRAGRGRSGWCRRRDPSARRAPRRCRSRPARRRRPGSGRARGRRRRRRRARRAPSPARGGPRRSAARRRR